MQLLELGAARVKDAARGRELLDEGVDRQRAGAQLVDVRLTRAVGVVGRTLGGGAQGGQRKDGGRGGLGGGARRRGSNRGWGEQKLENRRGNIETIFGDTKTDEYTCVRACAFRVQPNTITTAIPAAE